MLLGWEITHWGTVPNLQHIDLYLIHMTNMVIDEEEAA